MGGRAPGGQGAARRCQDTEGRLSGTLITTGTSAIGENQRKVDQEGGAQALP